MLEEERARGGCAIARAGGERECALVEVEGSIRGSADPNSGAEK